MSHEEVIEILEGIQKELGFPNPLRLHDFDVQRDLHEGLGRCIKLVREQSRVYADLRDDYNHLSLIDDASAWQGRFDRLAEGILDYDRGIVTLEELIDLTRNPFDRRVPR